MTQDELYDLERLNRKAHGDPFAMPAYERAFTFTVVAELIRLATIGLQVEACKGQVRRAWELSANLHQLLEKHGVKNGRLDSGND